MWPFKKKIKEIDFGGGYVIQFGEAVNLPDVLKELLEPVANFHIKAKQHRKLYAESHYLRRAITKNVNAAMAVKTKFVDKWGAEIPPSENLSFNDILGSNPFYTPMQMNERVLTDYLIQGNALVEIQRKLNQLVPLLVDNVSIEETRDPINPYVYKVTDPQNSKNNRVVLPQDMIHIKAHDPGKWFGWGISIIESSKDKILNSMLVDITMKELAKRGANLRGILTVKGPGISHNERELIYRQWDEVHSGPKGRDVALFTTDMQFTPTTIRPVDLEFGNLETSLEKQIHLAYGIPPQVAGIAEASTFSNYEQAWRSYYDDTIGPMLRRILDEFSHKLFPDRDIFIKPDFTSINAFVARMIDQVKGLEYQTTLTKNEVRQAIGYPGMEIENADTLLSRLGLIPLEQVGQEFGIDPEAIEEM